MRERIQVKDKASGVTAQLYSALSLLDSTTLWPLVPPRQGTPAQDIENMTLQQQHCGNNAWPHHNKRMKIIDLMTEKVLTTYLPTQIRTLEKKHGRWS